MSGSTSESPTPWPCATRNVNAIAPPTRIVSQRSSSASITPSLSLDLRAAEHRDERVRRAVEQARQHFDLAVQQPAARVREQPRRADDRRVRPVRRAERLVHVEVAEPSTSVVHECRVVLRLPGSKRRFSSSTTSPRLDGATTASAPGRRPSGASGTSARRAARTGAPRPAPCVYCGVERALRTAEVPAPDDDRALLAQPLDRRQRGRDAEVVLDGAVVGSGTLKSTRTSTRCAALDGRSSRRGRSMSWDGGQRRRYCSR